MAVTRYVRSRFKIHIQANQIKDIAKVKEGNQTTYTLEGATYEEMDPDELKMMAYLAYIILRYGWIF
jgi:hypothetical protein